MIELILARHGESDYSAVGLVNGDPSVPVGLTARGREEASRLGASLAGEPLDLCVVTDFPRTHETADLALAGRDIPRLVLPDLNDPRAGIFEGRGIGEFREWFRDHGAAVPVPGGESRVEVVERYRRAFGSLLARPESTILVIAHGLPVTYAVLAARGEDLPVTLEGRQVEHAVPHRMDAGTVRAVTQRLTRWVDSRGSAA